MNLEALKAMIACGETMTLEFKGEAEKPLSDREMYEAVVCLANAQGGALLIGVEGDGRITGARKRHQGGTTPEWIQAAIFNNTEPPLGVGVKVYQVNHADILFIEVPKVAPGVCTTKDGKCIHRVMGVRGPECQPYYPHQQQAQRVSVGDSDYSASLMSGTDFDDLNPLEIERLRQTVKQRGGETRLLELNDEELTKALGLVETRGESLSRIWPACFFWGVPM